MIKILRDNLESMDSYRGSNRTKWRIVIDGKTYMVKESFRNKISDHRRHKKFRRPDNKTVTGYNNSVYSEYVASNVINFLNFNGVKAHNVTLGVDEEGKIYNVCEDFRYIGLQPIYNFYSIYDTIRRDKLRFDQRSIEGIYKFIEKQKYLEPKTIVKYFLKHVYDGRVELK